jgi:hypothetical protein
MQTVCFSEMMVSTYESTQRHNPDQQYCHLHHHKNLKSHLSLHILQYKQLPQSTMILQSTGY